MKARYVHTNLVARDWRNLAHFYQSVFGCEMIPPERDLTGEWIERATGIPQAHIYGAHLRLPGGGESGPTLEIFQYDQAEERTSTAVNRPGYGHIAFQVDDVARVLQTIIAAGGGQVGAMVSLEVAGLGVVQFVYATDPEGNVIEIQRWT